MNDLVSIIIPTKNSRNLLENCLKSIRNQTYKNIEIIIVDGKSTDGTEILAKKYKSIIYTYIPKVKKGAFDASFKRNYGARKAKGKYIYWMDADMEIPKKLIEEAVALCKHGHGAVILPEDSFGTGMWARAKNLERRCYWGDDTVECPRFFKQKVWQELGGLDESLGAGGDDLDLHQKTLENGYTVGRTKSIVMHNEGALTITKLIKKHFMYGRDTVRYVYKRPKESIISYFPVRRAYLRNLHLFVNRPVDSLFFVIMRTSEYFAGFLGFLYSFIIKNNQPSGQDMDIETYAQYLPQYYDDTIPETLEKYLKLRSYKTLIDSGCGDGSLLYALKNKGYFNKKKIYAIDLSKHRINIVKKLDPNINAKVDNAETLKTIKTASIDFFISSYVIEHIDDKKMLASVARITKKNATIYISTVFKKWYGWYYRRRNGKWVMDPTHLREYSKDEELLSLIDTKKFSIAELSKKQLYFPIMDFLIRRIAPTKTHIFTNNQYLKTLRNIKLPIIGYYEWEIILYRK